MNGIPRVQRLELVVQDLAFQRKLPNRRVIEVRHHRDFMGTPMEHEVVFFIRAHLYASLYSISLFSEVCIL